MKVFSLLFNYYKPFTLKISFGIILLILVTILEIFSKILFKHTIDFVIPNKNIYLLWHAIVLFLIFNMLGLLFSFFTSLLNVKVSLSVLKKMKLDLLEKLHKIIIIDYQKSNYGYWAARIQNDTDNIFSIVTDTLFSIIRNSIMVVFSACILFYYNWLLTLIIILVFPLHIIFSKKFMKNIHDATSNNQKQNVVRDKQLLECLTMLSTCVQFKKIAFNLNKFRNKLDSQVASSYMKFFAEIRFQTFNTGIFQLIPLFIIVIGSIFIIKSKMTIGALLLFIMLSQQLLSSISSTIRLISQLIQAKVHLTRIQEMISIQERTDNTILTSICSLKLENINLFYNNTRILNNINLEIIKGDKICILGKSGCGKTSLLKILNGLLKPQSGNIFLNHDIVDLTKFDLRDHMNTVWQEPSFYNSNVVENIVFDSLNEDIESQMKRFNIDFHSMKALGVNGNKLSSGQKQRLSILRSICQNYPILIFDEPLVNLDKNNQKLIIDFIRKEKTKTFIIVSHNYNLISICNKVFEFKKNNLVLKSNI